MNIANLPKLDLHCHLDGSLTKDIIEGHLGRAVSDEELTISEQCRSLTEYLRKFDLPVQCLQDAAGLSDGAYRFVEEIAKEKIEYIEVRFAPMLSAHDGLPCAQVIEAVRDGMERAKEAFHVRYGIITCAMRHHSGEQNLTMLRCAREYLGMGVCALDLAGMNRRFRQDVFRPLFEEARRLGMPFTIHSGETGNMENVREAYELGARRIGHGIALWKDTKLMKAYAEAGIGCGNVSDKQLPDKGGRRMGSVSAPAVCRRRNQGEHQHRQSDSQRHNHDKRTDKSIRAVRPGRWVHFHVTTKCRPDGI